ncbi:MAG: hypothetical protein JXA33_12535 [Anaerolineae bacterium]|nr:hypothetical protein [Anaerolineae bacterium]
MSNCFCGEVEHPPKLVIPAGLNSIPRQIAGFPEFRRAMLAAIRRYPALNLWQARGDDDFGLMLLEMWAYVADVQAFYDEVIAHESYLRTARQRPSLRRLVNLLGYVPRPAVAASVSLAVFAAGRHAIELPQGLAFRSAAFEAEPPQVFELDAKTVIHPLNNQWSLSAPPQTTLSASGGSATQNFNSLLLATDAAFRKNDLLLARAGSSDTHTQVRTITAISDTIAADGKKYKQVTFSSALLLPGNTIPASVQLLRPTQTGSLWKITATGNPASISSAAVILDGLYRFIAAGQYIILGEQSNYRWFRVVENREVLMTISPATTTIVKDADDNDVSVAAPAVKAPATQLVLDGQINANARKDGAGDWVNNDATKITLYCGLVSGGRVALSAKTIVTASDSLVVSARPEQPVEGTPPTSFLLQDKNEIGHVVDATLNYATGAITLEKDPGWSGPLTLPVTLYGNVVSASRGETVANEVLGSGDASLPNQSFRLKKNPLTYTSSSTAGNEQGVASTLKVYVEGILWQERPGFFGVGPDAPVYIVRQNDKGEAIITFGDGQRGARLPTGSGNIVASYRYGAGKAAPLAGAITQLAKPCKGLTGVKSPLAATGGDDAETSDRIRTYAPQSALLLGRAVSIIDMEVAAATVPGVRSVVAEWRWHNTKQRPVIQVWYIGDATSKDDVGQKLRNLSDPTTLIAVEGATPYPVAMSLNLEIAPRYLEDNVLPEVRAALTDSEKGLLSPERVGIGQPLFRSRIFEVVNSIVGVVCVQGILLKFDSDFWPWTSSAITAPAGSYLDFERGGLWLNGKESDSD